MRRKIRYFTRFSQCVLLVQVGLVGCSGRRPPDWALLSSAADADVLANAIAAIRSSSDPLAPAASDFDRIVLLLGHENVAVRYQALRLLSAQETLDKRLFCRALRDSDSGCRVAALLGVAAIGWTPTDTIATTAYAESWEEDESFDCFARIVFAEDRNGFVGNLAKWANAAATAEKARRFIEIAATLPCDAAVVVECEALLTNRRLASACGAYLQKCSK